MENALPARIIHSSEGDVLPEFYVDVGKAIGQEYRHILIGSDRRPSTDVVKSAFTAGALSTGAIVFDVGCVPLQTMPLSECDANCIMYFGNPDNNEYMSGLDLMNRDGTYFSDLQMFRLGEYIKGSMPPMDKEEPRNITAIPDYIDEYGEKLRAISGNPNSNLYLKFFIDAMSHNTPVIMNTRNTLALMVNCHMDNRSTERIVPNSEEDLKMLAKTVKANYGSVGIAINAEGTRIAGIDENGGYIGGTMMFALLMDYLKPESVALPIDTPMMITDLFESKYTFTPVSSQRIGAVMKEKGLKFGGSADGTFIFPASSYIPDGIMAANIVSLISSEWSLANFMDNIPEYMMTKTSMRYAGDVNLVTRRMDTVLNSLNYDHIHKSDGWRLDYGEGLFVIRINEEQMTIDIKVESKDKVYSTGLMEIATEAVDTCLKGINR